jgi:DNA polymerase-1
MIFGILFGLGRGPNLLNYLIAKGVKTTMKIANRFYDRFFVRYVGVKRFIDLMRKQAEDSGVVETLFGFRRDIGQWDTGRTTYWGNQAVNTPIQGSAHQLLLMALALLHLKPKTYRLLRKPVLEIHDALGFFVPLRHLFEARAELQQLLQEEVPRYVEKHFGRKLRVPLLSEASAGFTLGSMTELEGIKTLDEFLERWRQTRKEHLAEGWKDLEMEE